MNRESSRRDAFAPTLDEAAKKATRFMIAYLVDVHELERHEANMLCSVAADLKIAEVVDGNVLVSMHISKSLFKGVLGECLELAGTGPFRAAHMGMHRSARIEVRMTRSAARAPVMPAVDGPATVTIISNQ
jgi:hypothetical protein